MFLPVIIFGLKWGLNKWFVILCSIGVYGLFYKIGHYFFLVRTEAWITYIGCMLLMSGALVWSVVMEVHEGLQEHILKFPQDQWLVPCSEDKAENKKWQTVCLILGIISAVFMFATGWG